MTEISNAASVCIHQPETINLLGAQMLIVARMGEKDDDTVLIRSTMGTKPRQIPLHAHADIESFYVIVGSLEVYIEDAAPGWRTVTAGQSLTIPSNVRHAVRNVSGAPVDSILATTVRIARFFGEIATPEGGTASVQPSPEEMAHLRSTAEKYGYWMGSPAQNAEMPA